MVFSSGLAGLGGASVGDEIVLSLETDVLELESDLMLRLGWTGTSEIPSPTRLLCLSWEDGEVAGREGTES